MKGVKPLIAEFLGTFLLVFIGPGAAIADHVWSLGLGNFGVAVVFGVVVFLAIGIFGNMSGAHINPVVTAAFLVRSQIGIKRAASYVMAQVIGALAAFLGFRILFSMEEVVNGCTLPHHGIAYALGAEVLFTFVMVFTIFTCLASRKMPLIVLAIFVGASVFLGAFLAGPVSGGSFNPARTLGPALAAGRFDAGWIYIAGPLIGSLLAAGLSKAIFTDIDKSNTA